jgi:hypothetical protein
MQMLNQQSVVIKGSGAAMGEIIDTNDRPIDALKTILLQITKAREWQCSQIGEAIHTIQQACESISMTFELAEMQMESAIESLEIMQEQYELLQRKVAHGCTDANCSLCDPE